MISLQPSHLTHSPSGTVLRRRSARIGLGCLAFLNQTMENDSRAASVGGARGLPGEAGAGVAAGPIGAVLGSEAGGLVPLFGLQVVGDPETHASAIVHLARSLLRVLQFRQAVLDLRQLVLDRTVELFHLLLRYLESVLVKLSLLLGKAHGLLPIAPRPRAPTATGPGRLAYRPSRLLLERDTQAGPHLDPGPIPGRGSEARSPRHLERGLVDPDILADSLQQLDVLDAALLVDQDRQDDDALDPEFPGERRILRFGRADKFRRHRRTAVRGGRAPCAGGGRAGAGAPGRVSRRRPAGRLGRPR